MLWIDVFFLFKSFLYTFQASEWWWGGVRRGGTDVKDVDKCAKPITGNAPLSLPTAMLLYSFDQKKICI